MNQACRFNRATVGTSEVAYGYHSSYGSAVGNEAWLQDRVANIGPISVAIYVNSNFQHYASGVYKDRKCNKGCKCQLF